MSRSTQQLKELTTGVHLVILGGFLAVKNPDGSLKESETGEKLIQVRFTDGFNKSFDKQYWVKGNREHEFNKMISCAGLDRSKFATFKDLANAATGLRIWISIREVYEIDGENEIGEKEYQIFDYDPCLNPEKKPTKKGDPANGQAGGDFIACKQIKKTLADVSYNGMSKEEFLKPAIEAEEKLRESPNISQNQEEKTAWINQNSVMNTNHKTSGEITERGVWGDAKSIDAGFNPGGSEFDNLLKESKIEPTIDKKEVIAKAKEMIAKVESKTKTESPKSDAINWDDCK
jgi:hypothetical protein